MLGRFSMAALAAAVIAAAPGATIAPEVRSLLTSQFRFSAVELSELERGRIVRRILDATGPGEVAAVGAVRVGARVESFIDRVQRIETFKRGPDVIEIGRFGNPPLAADLSALTIGRDDLDLRKCRVGSCDIRLPADAIGRFQREIDWKAADADDRAAALFKQLLAAHVRAYLIGGPGRIAEYDDEKRIVRPVDDFAAVLKASPFVGALVPGLADHLRDPRAMRLESPPPVDEFLYWSKERSGPLAPFISVTHLVICQPSADTYVIATRDVYSSRYFDASLSYMIATRASGAPNAFYLIYENRSRAAALKGAFASLRRSLVERRARNSLEENLRNTKMTMEGTRQ